MKKSILYVLIIMCAMFVLVSCNKDKKASETLEQKTKEQNVEVDNTNSKNNKNERDERLNIVTTDKLIYDIVSKIVGDKHNVEYIFKNRFVQENFVVTSDCLLNIGKKDLFFYAGASFDPWMDNFLSKLSRNNVLTVDLSRGVDILNYSSSVKIGGVEVKENPYYWASIHNFKIMLLNIKNAIQDKDAKNRDYYEQNYNTIVQNINILEQGFKSLNNSLKDITFLCGDENLEYFFKWTGLKTLNIKDYLKNDKDVKEKIEKQIEGNKSKMILVFNKTEELVLYKQLLAKNSFKTVKITPYMEGKSYMEFMRINLENLLKLV